MMLTEILMVASTWFYIVPRFMCGSLTWTCCSFAGWAKEYFNTMAIKERILFMKYPAWGYEKVKFKDEEKEEKELEVGCCGARCCNCCMKCKRVNCCPCDVNAFCDLGCSLLCEMT